MLNMDSIKKNRRKEEISKEYYSVMTKMFDSTGEI